MKREVALVTGASTGIGRACAEQLAAAGFAVYGTARRPGRSSGGVNMIPLDVRDDNSVMACVKRVLREAGQIDVLVNNAGVAMEGAIEETSLEEIRGVMETNFFGVVRMIREVLPSMRQQQRGRIINMGSMAGFLPMPYSAAYCASKHALRGLTESLDHEVRNFGIRACLIEPGFIQTEIAQRSPVAATQFEPYISARSRPSRAFRREVENGVDPHVVAETVVKAATTDFPRPRYLPDGTATMGAILRSAIPAPIFDFLFRKQMGLD